MNRDTPEARDPGRAAAVLDLVQDHRGRGERGRREPRPDDREAAAPLRQHRGARPRRQPDLDNGNFVVAEANEIDGTAAFTLPLEATPRIARRATWLVTDNAYKEALIQLRARLEARKAGGAAVPNDVPALDAREAARQRRAGAGRSAREPRRARDAREGVVGGVPRSARAARFARRADQLPRAPLVPHDRGHERDRHAARERPRDRRRAARPTDGQLVHDYFLRYGRTAKDLPSDDELKAESKRLAGSVAALEKAPVIDHYSGPVLFEGEGAVGIVRATLGAEPGRHAAARRLESAGGQAVRRRVQRQRSASSRCRAILSLVDDPTTLTTGPNGTGKALIGGYKVDDEGVAAQKVEVVKDGWLKIAAHEPHAVGARARSRTVTRGARPKAARSRAARRTCS